MAEPIPQNPETAVPKPIVIGETPLYLKTPIEMNGTSVNEITILGADKRALDGVGSTVPLVRELSRRKGEEGKMIDKPLTNVNAFDEISWDKISGVQWTDEKGVTHILSKDELQLTPPAAETPNEIKADVAPEKPVEQPVVTPEQASEPVPSESPASETVMPENVHTPTPEEAAAIQQENPVEPAVAETAEVPAAEQAGITAEVTPEQPVEPVPPVPTPAKEARNVLETLTEDPNTITIVGLKAYETRALDLADRSMQKLGTPKMQEHAQAQQTVWERAKSNLEGIKRFVVENMWKQSIGGIYFHEKARQYYLDMLQVAETPFAESSIRLAERRATDIYNAKLADANFLVRIGTKSADALRDFVGMRTTVQKMALEELGIMKAKGELTGAETFDREARAVRARFGQDMDKAASFVREQLGEKLEILNPENPEHKPLVEGIQTLIKQYATGEIPDKAEFDNRTKEFFSATLKNVRPDIFAEAELYSSSLFEAAENLKMKMSHEAGLTNIDDALSQIQIRLGLAQMGEVTSLEPTAVEAGVGRVREVFDWLNKKNVIVPMVFNEATVGSAVAIALSATKLISTMPARALAGIGGGALAGGLFAGWREYGQLQRDYMTHLRERESGANFTEMQKKRAWFERFSPKQRSAAEMISTIQSSMYEETGAVKAMMTDDELRTAFATVADTQARKAVSENGPKRVGLVRYTARENIESERAALDITANKALGDLESYLAAHGEQAESVLGGNTFEEFMVKLTSGQADILRQGVQTAEAFEDPVKDVLGLVSQYAPEASVVKRRWPFASRLPSDQDKALGLDQIFEEFNKEAKVEATKYGIRAGVIGAAVGVIVKDIELLGHYHTTVDTNVTTHPVELPAVPGNTVGIGPDATHLTNYQLPSVVHITPHAESGKLFYDAKLDWSTADNLRGTPDSVLGNHLTGDQLKGALEKAGFSITEPHKAGEVLSSIHHVDTITNITSPAGDKLTASLPDGYSLHYVDAAHGWQLMGVDNHPVANLQFTDTGDLKGTPDQIAKLSKELLDKYGLKLDHDVIRTVHVPEATAPVGPEAPISNAGNMDIQGNQLGDGGLWNHFMKQAQDAHGEHTMSTTNGVKNMFRMYEQYQVPHDANGIPTNITDHNGASIANDLHLRAATYAGTPVKEFDIAKIPSDAHINVPKELFSPESVKHFGELNDRAIAHYQELVASGKSSMDALHTLEQSNVEADKVDAVVLRLGYFGRDSDLPAKADMTHLFNAMGLGHEPVTNPVIPPVSEKAIDIHQFMLTRVYKEDQIGEIASKNFLMPEVHKVLDITRDTLPDKLPWIPIFIPVREALEPVLEPTEKVMPKQGELMFSPYGSEESFLTREQVAARKSPTLTENPTATLKQQEEIAWYLGTLTPEEQTMTADLLSQIDTPISPDVRTVVTLPVSGNGSSIYQRLSAYANQTDTSGNPLNPSQSEIVVYDVLAGDQQPDQTKAEVDRFKTEHPDSHVVYLTHTYTEAPPGGRIKKDLSNAVLTRISTLPVDAPDTLIVSDNGTGTELQPTYVSSIIETMDQNPTLDIVSGTVTLPQEVYGQYPMLFAQHRAFELFDSLARHGDMDAVPYVYNGNMAIRAGTLAGVGGYNDQATHLDERQLAWVTKAARNGAETTQALPSMAVTIEPKDVVYKHLQAMGIADAATPLSANEVYKDMPWQEMAQKASDAYTKEQFESDVNAMYDSLYPTLKATNPDRFDAYFKRTMDALGVSYEKADGKLVITDITKLTENVGTELDTDAFAKSAAEEIVAATPTPPETSRESLEQLAGIAETAPVTTEAGEAPTTPVTEGISSPEVTLPEQPTEQLPAEQPTEQPAVEQPAQEQPLAEPQGEAVASSIPTPEAVVEQPQQIPEGVEEKIRYVLESAKEKGALVQVTPGELMDYIKSSVDIGGSRITGGTIQVEGKTVKLQDMKAKTPVGEAQFSGELVSDPNRGLIVNRDALQLHLPLLARLAEGTIRQNLNNFNTLMLDHINSKFDDNWKANRIDVVGENLQIRFNKKTT